MPDNSKNDWLVASISKPDLTLGDFEQMGLTPDNTQLLNEKDYKKSEQIQKLFTNPTTGKFDDDQFKQHYDVATQTFNDFAKKEYDSTLLNNNYFFEENFHAPKDAKRFKNTINIGKVKNPFNQTSGIEGFTTKTDSGLSVREIAQTQNIYDNVTDKALGFTPNESGFFGTLFKPTTVLAQYDSDGEHLDADSGRMVKHGKGEYKYNENGKPYYETLGDREIYGKQALSAWDVLTEDGSSANKWDFMDADSKTKSLTGTIFKTAATVVPMFIPGVGQWYTGLTLGSAIMTDLLPVLTKSTAGLFLNEDLKDTKIFEYANELQKLGARYGGSVSDEAKESTFNKENIFAMAGDVFGQLAQQRLIAKVPMWLGQSAKEAEAFAVASGKYGEATLKEMSTALKAIKGPNALQDKATLLRTKWGADFDIVKVLEKWDKWASVGSKSLGVAYMSGISATGVAEEAKLHGLDERDTAALFLGTMSGFGLMMTKFEFAHWALEGMGLDELGGFMKSTIKKRVGEIMPTINRLADTAERKVVGAATRNVGAAIEGEIAQAGTEATKKTAKDKLLTLFNKGKEIGKSLSDSLGDISTIKQKMLAEGLEETTEEAMQDGIKLVYNGMRALGMTSTDESKSEAFDFKDIGSRYLMSAIGGAMGGGIAGIQDAISGQVHDSLPPTLKREIASAVRHGYASTLQDIVDKQRDQGKLGSKSLSIKEYTADYKLTDEINYEPVSADNAMSHNDFVHAMISAEIKLAKDTIFQEGIQSDLRLNDIYEQRTNTFVDLKLNTGIVKDIDDLTNDIIDLKAKIKESEGTTDQAKSQEDPEKKAKVSELTKELEEKRQELFDITSGNKALKYTKEALFSVNGALNQPFNIESKDSLAFKEYQKRYEHLTAIEKEDINSKYQDYATYEKRIQLRKAHQEFEKLNNEEFNQFIPDLATYAKQRKAFVDNFVDINTSLNVLQMEKQEDVDKIDNSTLAQLNVGHLELDPGKSAIVNFANIVAAEKYLNPVMLDYVKTIYNVPYKVEEGQDTASIFTRIYSDDEVGLLPMSINPGDVDLQAIKSYTSVDVKDLLTKLSPWNYAETVEKLNEVPTSAGFQEMLDNAIDSETGSTADPKIIKDAYLQSIDAILKGITTVQKLENSEVVELPNDVRLEELQAIDSIKKSYASKPNNPLLDFISDLTKRDGREGFGNLIDIINTTFNDLTAKGVANDFIIDNKISIEQLEYGANLLDKVSAVIGASTNWEGPTGDTRVIGYNAASNAIAERNNEEDYEILNTFDVNDGVTIGNDLELLKGKINFLLNLHKFNANGSIRELKLTGATMSTLYLQAIQPGSFFFEHLEGLGIDLSELTTKFSTATQYQENLTALNSPSDAKLTLKSTDDAFFKIRQEKDAIEQELYKAINSRPDRVEILNKIFDTIKPDDFVNGNSKVNFSSNVRQISKGQELIYFAQVVTIDPKQFYNDFVGNLPEGENLIKEDPYAPFYGQEHALKQMYWHMISKMSPVDTQNKVANILLKPDRTLTEEENNLHKANAHAPNLKNATVLYGIPGAGKTTSALYYITKIAERYGIDAAVFAPHQEQGDNLKKSLKDRPNVYNEKRGVPALMQSFMGDELYSAMDADYTSNNVVQYKLGDPIDKIDTSSTLMNQEGEGGYSSIVYNPNHPLVAKFLNDKSTILNYEGKVPGMIIIDEATHVRGAELQLLNLAVEQHNKNSKQPVSLILVGDREQRGFSMKINDQLVSNNISVMFTLNTPVLSQSLRNRFNVKNKNINMVRSLRQTIENAHSKENFAEIKTLLDAGLTFDYAVDDTYGLVGEQMVTDFTKENLEGLFANPNETVALITDKVSPSLMKIIESIPGAKERLVTYPPDKVQGLEYDNIIIDMPSNDRRPVNIQEMINTYDALEMLYTMISRSKKGSLIKAPFIKSIAIKSTNEDVLVQKIELAPKIVEDYKTFTLTGIEKSYTELEDLSYSPTEYRKEPTKAGTEGMSVTPTAEVFQDEAYKVIQKQVETPSEDNTQGVDMTGEVVPISSDEVRPITYTFHERTGMDVRGNKIHDTKNNPIIGNQDLAGIYSIMFDADIDDTMSFDSANITSARANIRRLKAGLLAYSQKTAAGESVPALQNFLFLNYKVNQKLLKKFDFSKMRAKIETKEYDSNVDLSHANRAELAKAKGGGLISYLVLELPHFKSDELTFLTVSAFPNTNNENVTKLQGVMRTMNSIRDNHTRFSENGTSDFYLKPDATISSVLNPTSNLYIRQTEPRAFKDFKAAHDHLGVSDPFILMNSNIISPDSETVQAYFNNFNRGGVGPNNKINKESSSLIGRPVVFVSLDKSIPTNQLAGLYIKQLNEQTAKRARGESTEDVPGNIRMVMLNKKGIPVKEWLSKNITIANKTQESNIDLKAQRRAYSNNFAAASMLGALINFKRRAEYYIASGDPVKLPSNLGLDLSPKTTLNLIGKIDAIIKTAVPLLTGKTFTEIYLGTNGGTVNSYVEAARAKVDDFLQTVFDGNESNKAKAVEHFIASDLLAYINKHEQDGAAQSIKDTAGQELRLNLPNSALYNFVNSLRLTMVGGSFTNSEGVNSKVDGLYPHAFTAGSTDETAFNNLMTALEQVLAYKFPDGVHINPVIRTASADNRYEGDAPFVVPTGNIDEDFMVDVEVQTPTIYFDPRTIDFRNPDVVEEDENKLVEDFGDIAVLVNDAVETAVNIPVLEPIKAAAIEASLKDNGLNVDALNDIKDSLKGDTVEQRTQKAIGDALDNVTEAINNLPDNVVDIAGTATILEVVEGQGVVPKPLVQAAQEHAQTKLGVMGAVEQNIAVTYTESNELGTTDKVREFTISNADNNEIIGNFVYKNKGFSDVNYLNPLPTNITGIEAIVKGTFVESHFAKINLLAANPEGLKTFDLDDKLDLGKSYFLLGSYLKANNFNLELEEIRKTYNNIIEQTKC